MTALEKVNEYIDMLHIQAISKVVYRNSSQSKVVTNKNIEEYLKKKGYVFNNVGEKPVWTKGFTVVQLNYNSIEVWIDIKNSKKSIIDHSFLTSLPIFLNYFERI